MKKFKEVSKKVFEQLLSNVSLHGWYEIDSPVPCEGNILRVWRVESLRPAPASCRDKWIRENATAYYDVTENKYYIDEEL